MWNSFCQQPQLKDVHSLRLPDQRISTKPPAPTAARMWHAELAPVGFSVALGVRPQLRRERAIDELAPNILFLSISGFTKILVHDFTIGNLRLTTSVREYTSRAWSGGSYSSNASRSPRKRQWFSLLFSAITATIISSIAALSHAVFGRAILKKARPHPLGKIYALPHRHVRPVLAVSIPVLSGKW